MLVRFAVISMSCMLNQGVKTLGLRRVPSERRRSGVTFLSRVGGGGSREIQTGKCAVLLSWQSAPA